MDSARSKLARFGMAAGACALLGSNAFTINCGFAPTDIGDETTATDGATLAAQPSALLSLLESRSVVLESAGTTLCLSLSYQVGTSEPRTDRFQINCNVTAKIGESAAEPVDDSQCRFTVTGDGPRQIVLECAKPGGTPCVGSALEVGRLTTTADFVELSESNTSVDAMEFVDTTDPSVKATIHQVSSYCSSDFSAR